MKTLVPILSVLLLACSLCQGQYVGDIVTTNIMGTNSGGAYMIIRPTLGATWNSPIGPTLSLTHSGSPGWTELLSIGNNLFTISGVPVGGGSAVPISLIGNVNVTGNLGVSGSVTAGSAVFTVTNYIDVTNAMNAANVWYATNSQTAAVNMSLSYSDYDTSTAPTFTVDPATCSTTNYQTAVVFVRQNPASTNVFAISTPAEASRQGTFNLTNVTVLTWFYNPHVPFTNVVALPLY